MEALQISVETATRFYTWGWRASICGAAVTLIGVAFLWIGTRVRDRDNETKLALLNVKAARANEHAAMLALALEQLKQPRSLSNEQKTILRTELKDFVAEFDHKLTVSSINEDEPRMYAKQFMELFRSLGINLVNRAAGLDPHSGVEETERGPTDIIVLIKSDEYTSQGMHLVSALTKAGIPVTSGLMPNLHFGQIYLTVFSKR